MADSILLGSLQNGTVDTLRTTYVITDERSKDFQFSFPVRFITSGFVFKKPAYLGSANVLIQAFSPGLWLALVVALMSVFFAFVGNQLLYQCKNYCCCNVAEAFWTMFSFCSGTDFSECASAMKKKSRRSWKNTVVYFNFLVIFTITLYQSSLLSAMLSQHEAQTFRGTAELADLVFKKERYLVYTSPSYLSSVASSKTAAFLKMKAALKNNPAIKVPKQKGKTWQLVAAEYLIAHPRAVLVGSSGTKSELIASQLCGLMSKEDEDHDGFQMTAYMFRKGDPVLKRFNERIIARGLYPMKKIENSLKKQVRYNPELECPRLRPGDPLSLQRMLAIVFVIAGGAILGIFSLILENLKGRFWAQNRKKVQREYGQHGAISAQQLDLCPQEKSGRENPPLRSRKKCKGRKEPF